MWVGKLKTQGRLNDLRPKTLHRVTHSGRKKLYAQALKDRIRNSVIESNSRSTRKRSQTLVIPQTSMMRVMKEDFHLFPYRISTHQTLSDKDKEVRLEMSKVLSNKIEATARNGNKSFLSLLWTSDEAHCYLDGQVNSKNNIFWGSQKPDMVATTSLHSKKVTVWCALSQRGIIGPFYFEENEKTTTINSKRYIAVLKLFWQELHTQYPELHKRMWFQQDGAPAHTAKVSLDWLKVHFKK